MFLRRLGRWAALGTAFFLLNGSAGLSVADSPGSQFFTLDNGLRVYLLEKRDLPLVHAVVGVKAGSRNETDETSGLTHVLEHVILFRGSRTRTADEINRDIRRNGAYFNAHTGQDISLFEMTLPAGREDFALRNMADILFNLRVDAGGLEAERAVILEEMSQAQDDPFRAALAAVYRNLFPGHPYSLPIAGTRESLLRLTAEQLETHCRTYFTPSNSVLAVTGDFDALSLKDQVGEIYGSLPKADVPSQRIPPASPLSRDVDVTLEMDVAQAVCVLGFAGPDYNHPDQFPVDLLTEILGRGVNPLLGSALRGERRLVESVSMSYQAHELGGAVIVTLALDPRQLRAAAREALSFLRTARRLNFTPDDVFGAERESAFDYLESARNQLRFLAEKSGEKGLNLAVSLARHMLLAKGESTEGYLKSIANIKTSDLRRAASKYFGEGRAVVVRIVPSAREGTR